jgi:hypothetical protein
MKAFLIAFTALNVAVFIHLSWREAHLADRASDAADRQPRAVVVGDRKPCPEVSLAARVYDEGRMTPQDRGMAESRPWLLRTRGQDRSFLFICADLIGRPSSDLDDLIESPGKVYRLREGCKDAYVAMTRISQEIQTDVDRIADERIRTGRADVEPAPFPNWSSPDTGAYYVTRPVPDSEGRKVYVVHVDSDDDAGLKKREAEFRDAKAAVAAGILASLKAIGHS